MLEYPRNVFRPGKQERIWNEFDCDSRLVHSEGEHKAALADGWYDHPSCRTAQETPAPDPEPEPDPTPDPEPEDAPANDEPAPEAKPAAKRRGRPPGSKTRRRRRGKLTMKKAA